MTLSWASVDPATPTAQWPTTYRITVLPGAITHVIQAPATSLKVTDLRNGVRYGFTITAINDAGESEPSPVVEATPSSAVEGEVDRLIVAYEPGVKVTEAPGVATGSSSVEAVELTPGAALGTGMRTVELSEAVDDATAERIADELTDDPRVKWAEPDYFVPMLDDAISPQGLPAKPGRTQSTTAGAKSTKAPGQSAPQASGPEVGAQTACIASPTVEPIARCFDDGDFDAGASVNGEIVWSDAYVTAGNRSRLLIDAVPWAQIQDANWLLLADTYLMACVDTNGDGSSETCVIPQWAALGENQSTGVSIYDLVNGAWTLRGATCSGTTTRRAGDHAAIGGSGNSWWQFGIDWSCLLGASSGSVRVSAFLKDGAYPAGDYSPDAYAGIPINFTTMTNATAPTAPTGIGIAPGSGALAVSWSAPSNDGGAPITGYTARAFGAASGGSPLASCSTAATTCVIGGLTPGAAVWVDVIAVNAVGAGAPSSPRTSGVPASATTPGTPTALTISPSSGTLTARWNVPASDGGSRIASYVARAYAQPSGGTAVASCATATQQCQITGLVNGQAYWIDVAAANAVGSGAAASPRLQATPAVVVTPTDPYYANGSLWGLSGTYGVSAPEAWAITRGSASTVVAVLDTGSTVHPDLDGTTIPGYDMIAAAAVAADGNGRDPDPSDAGDAYAGAGSSWHGTHVAGTINAIASNGVGVVGVAPDVKVQHVRVLGAGGGYTSDILAGITWASGGSVPGVPANPNPAKVINMSLGGFGSCGPDWQTAIDSAVARGTTIVVAAGNSAADASGFTPASCAKVITVAAIASTGKRASFSNYGSMVEVAAPGVAIWSTLNSGTTTPVSPSYASYSGTSMATPHVAGVVALMVSREPGLTPAQVTARLTTPSLLTEFPGGACDASVSMSCGAGIVNAARILGAASVPAATVPGAPTSVAGTAGIGQVIVSWAAPVSNGGSAITGYTARAFTALSGGTSVGSCTTASLTCAITGLASGVTYYLEVTATNAVGTGPTSSPRASSMPASAPGAPTAVAAVSAPASATVTWTAPANSGGSAVTGYTARAFTAASGGAPIATCTSATTACTISPLVNGTTAYVDVVATNAVGTGVPSAPRVAVMPRTVPSAPTGVLAAAGNGQATVSWRPPVSTGGSAITGYTAWAFTTSSEGVAAASCAATATGCVIGGLMNGVSYYVEVVATNAVGSSVPASPRVAVTPRTTPAAATAVVLTPGAGQLAVGWTAPTSTGGLPITGYVARAFTSASGGIQAATCSSSATTCLLGGLANGVTYYVDVVAMSAAGSAPASSPRVAGTPRTVPAAPRRVAVVPGNTQVGVSWTAPASTGGNAITGYTARAFSAASGGTPMASCTSTSFACSITGLANGTVVYVDVIAGNAAGDGTPSSPRVAVTPRTTPSSPTAVVLTSGAGQLTASWAAPASIGGSPITGYLVRAFTAPTGGMPVSSCTTTGALTCVIRGLGNGTTYYVEIIAINAAGQGLASSPRGSGVPTTVPAAVGALTATSQNASAAVSWQVPAFDGGTVITGYTARAWSTPVGGSLVASCTSATTGCTLDGLGNGSTYFVDAVATNAVGNGPGLARRVVIVPKTIPSAPGAVQARFGNGQLNVSWSPPSSNGGSPVTGYTARAFTDAASGSAVATCSSKGSTCAITGLMNGTSYFVEVIAANVVGSSVPGARIAETPRTVPSTPAAVQVTAGAGQLNVSWSVPTSDGGSPVASYSARAFLSAGGGSLVASCTATTASCLIPALSNGRAYFVDVVATNAVGSSAASTARVAGTPRTTPLPPVRVTAVPGNGQLGVSWSASPSNGGAPITSYTARATSGGKVVGTCTSAGLACAISGLVNGTPYAIEVTASNAAGTGAASAQALGTPRT